MNTYCTIRGATGSAIAVAALLATTASATARSAPDLRVGCGHRYIGMGDAARLFGTNNTSQVYARRQTSYANLIRACAARRRTTLEASCARRTANR
jgi:hypothetical protein